MVKKKKTPDKITTRFCSFIHFIWLTHNISFTHELFERVLICLRWVSSLCFCSQQPCCLSDTCNFISVHVDELYLVKNASASPFSQWKKDRTLNRKQTWWVRVQYQGLCQPTALWNESEHSSSDSLLEPCPPWATMRRLLGKWTWCGNYVTKRSAQNSNCSSNCCLFCVKIAWVAGKQQRILDG